MVRLDDEVNDCGRHLQAEPIVALWCGHCERLCLARGSRACRCVGPIDMGNAVTKRIYGTHVACAGCAAAVPAELLGDLLLEL